MHPLTGTPARARAVGKAASAAAAAPPSRDLCHRWRSPASAASAAPEAAASAAAPLPALHAPLRRATTIRRHAYSSSGAAGAAGAGPGTGDQESFRSVEALITRTLSGGAGGSGGGGNVNRWRQVEGSWVLHPPPAQPGAPPARPPQAVISFLGGAFVGAAPQLAYSPLLEALAARGAIVIATPYQLSFDHAQCADRVQYDLERCMRALDAEAEASSSPALLAPPPSALPVWGVAHSLGSLLQLLICSRYPYVARRGNVLMSFNNKPATETIPFLSPLLAPGARALGPLLQQLATSPLRSSVEAALDVLRGPASPPAVRQLLPVVDQLVPVMLDVASGRQEFTPAPAECREAVRASYGVGRNLLLRFRDDSIDETAALAQALQSDGAAVAPVLDLAVRVLPGDHARPLAATAAALAAELPPGVASVASVAAAAGGSVIGRLAEQAQAFGVPNASMLGDVGRGVSGLAAMLGEDPTQQSQQRTADGEDLSVGALADEIAGFMGLLGAGALPPARG